MHEISVPELARRLENRDTTAFIDVREVAEYNLAHIAGFCSLPRRLIEFRMLELVPFRGTPTVLCDDDRRRADLAARRLEDMGFSEVAYLAGGVNRWVTEGHSTEWGLNVPSKDFGEKVLLLEDVPEIEADELDAWLRRGDKVVILDARTPEEHQRACIPGSRSLPGGELALRVPVLAADPATPVVVHCAGRTRSIVGAATLKRMGLKNVYALKNGTMGWQLAGLELETGSNRVELPPPAKEPEAAARRLAEAEGVRYIGAADLEARAARSSRENVYLIDVRTREEHAAGHILGFRWVPGGQAVQQADNYVGVRGGTIVFACDGIVRASITASWFRGMGFPNVFVLEGGTTAWRNAGHDLVGGLHEPLPAGYEAARHGLRTIQPSVLHSRLQDRSAPTVVFVGTSEEFSQGHLPGGRWLPRGWLELQAEAVITPETPVVVTCADGVGSVLAAATLQRLGYRDVAVLEGGVAAWRKANLAIESGLTGIVSPPDDVLPARRSYAEMVNYLRWEEELGRKYAPPGN